MEVPTELLNRMIVERMENQPYSGTMTLSLDSLHVLLFALRHVQKCNQVGFLQPDVTLKLFGVEVDRVRNHLDQLTDVIHNLVDTILKTASSEEFSESAARGTTTVLPVPPDKKRAEELQNELRAVQFNRNAFATEAEWKAAVEQAEINLMRHYEPNYTRTRRGLDD